MYFLLISHGNFAKKLSSSCKQSFFCLKITIKRFLPYLIRGETMEFLILDFRTNKFLKRLLHDGIKILAGLESDMLTCHMLGRATAPSSGISQLSLYINATKRKAKKNRNLSLRLQRKLSEKHKKGIIMIVHI